MIPGFKRFVLCGAVAATFAGAAVAQDTHGPFTMRRITPEQYQQVISDVFGADIKAGAHFADQAREGGLVAISGSRTTITGPELQQFDSMARTLAAQIVDKDHRDLLIPCKPAAEKQADAACARAFLEGVGKYLFRRPLTAAELDGYVTGAGASAGTMNSFYDGLAFSLSSMLISPNFLFRVERANADADVLDAYSKASRLSFFLWNTQPDDELLAAAQRGGLDTPEGVAQQVDRMLASRRFENSVRSFFSDLLRFDQFAKVDKDSAIYPKFTQQVIKDAQEQTLRTLVDLLLTQRGDYRDIFTTRKTFLTPALGALYGVPVPKTTPNMEPADWLPIEYPQDDPRSGILMQASFVSLHSHPGRSSPTLRGKALREILLCQRVPDPPANVNFTVVQEPNNPLYKTARERLNAHATEAMCTGCHKITDPMGLAMEVFDGAGSFRARENGVPIDGSGALDGARFKNGVELGRVLHDHPSAPKCLVTRLTSYALGRVPGAAERPWVEALQGGFATGGYKLPDLYRRIATSPEFFRAPDQQTANLQ